MSQFTKSALKRARDAITAKDWDAAIRDANDVLEYEADNYNACVFLGLALLNKGRYDESEAAYRRAIKSNPAQLLAWQGISSFYEKTGSWSNYAETLRTVSQIYYDADDALKLAEALHRLIDCQREHGDRQEICDALSLLLPSSRFYTLLSTLPEPEPTAPTGSSIYEIQQLIHDPLPILCEITAATEANEARTIKLQIDQRKLRLDSGSAEQTRRLVQREVMSKSELPSLYRQILEHQTTSDELRRESESKLLQHLKTQLFALQDPFDSAETVMSEVQRDEMARAQRRAVKSKDALRTQVEDLAKGMILLKLPNELAWHVALDWLDVESAEPGADDYPLASLLDLCWHATAVPMSTVVRGHLLLAGRQDVIGDNETVAVTSEGDDKLRLAAIRETAYELIRDGLDSDVNGLMTHVLAATRFAELCDHVTVIEIANNGLTLLRTLSGNIGRRLSSTQRLLEAMLAIALVHHESPTHHRKALRLLDSILKEQHDALACHLARGYVMSASERWEDALASFEYVLQHEPSEGMRLETQGERAWALVHLGRFSDAQSELKSVLSELETKGLEGREERARVWWRLGTCYWEAGGELKQDPQHAYTAFVYAIKASPVFAPAFTSLGRFYLEVSSPPDHARASKCFQKAFELDPREDVAARLLADEFANEGQWDLVEVLARRVIAGAALQGSEERASAGSALARKHAWAWRAIGAAELSTHRYSDAVHALQSALRGAPADQSVWMQLGLAYRGAGQYVAALKTFNRVLQLDSKYWYAQFCAGDVQRTMGLLDAAISTFDRLVKQKLGGRGVQGVLAETLFLRARNQLRTGSRIKAESDLSEALRLCIDLISREEGVRIAWKVVADCLNESAELEDLHWHMDILEVLLRTLEQEKVDDKIGEALMALPTIRQVREAIAGERPFLRTLATVAYKMRLLLTIHDDVASTAWYDLALVSQRSISDHGRRGPPQVAEEQLLRAVMHCLRQALRIEPRNPIYWTAMGVAALDLSPRLSQHALIKAAEINPRSPIAWTHLGLFYIHYEDLALANEAFLRAQTLDPEFATAWLGQAAIAALNGDQENANVLIEHAWLLGGPLATALAYATVGQRPSPLPYDAHFSLARFLTRKPLSNATALHAYGLISERLGLFETAAESLTKAVATLEASYERDEDVTTEHRYAMASANLARVQLVCGRFDEAIDAADACLGLLGDDAEDSAAIKGQTALVKGLAEILAGRNESGLHTLEEAARLVGSKAALILARVLWQKGDAASRDEAKRQLLSHITGAVSGLPNLPAVASLGATAILSEDDDLLDAAVSEVTTVATDQRKMLDPLGDVDELLVDHALLQGNATSAVAVRLKALAGNPASDGARRALSNLLARSGNVNSAKRVLRPDDAPAGSVCAVLTRGTCAAQQAVRLQPWNAMTWEALACAT